MHVVECLILSRSSWNVLVVPTGAHTLFFLLIVFQFGEFLLTYIFKCALRGVESPDEPVGTVLFLSSTSI